MSATDYDAIREITDIRFPETSFQVSCFDSMEDIRDKPVTWLHDAIILKYTYNLKYYKHAGMFLEDADYIPVFKQKNEPYIRYCDVIDAILHLERAGAIKPNYHRFIEGIRRVEKDTNRVPMYEIEWGS